MFISTKKYNELVERIRSIESNIGIIWDGEDEYKNHEDKDTRWSVKGTIREIQKQLEAKGVTKE